MLFAPIMEKQSEFNRLSKKVKVAIVHDVLLGYGGSERVLEELLILFPQADLYTLYFNQKNKVINAAFTRRKPKTSILQSFTFINKLGRYFSVTKLYSWLYFYKLDLSKYDLVISSSHSFNSKIVRKPKNGFHLCYLHTPPKYLYKEVSEIGWLKKFPFKHFISPIIELLRRIDKKAAENPDLILVNSREVKKRVAEYYHRQATVVYPPVNVPKKIKKPRVDGKYYLFLSRLVSQKGPELAVATCSKYDLPLVVVGEGHLRKELEKIAGSTIQYLGWVEDSKLLDIFSNTKALIFSAQDEDFGIVLVEAMACGAPVVAYKSGGVKETVIDGRTGVFFEKYDARSLYSAINQLEKLDINPDLCHAHASKFSKEKFHRQIIKIVSKHLSG